MLLTNPKHALSIIWQEAKMYMSTELAHRWQIVSWVIADSMQPFFFAVVWSAVARGGGSGVSQATVVTYFFLVTIISKITHDWSVNLVTNEIIRGEFSKYLVKPFNYLSEIFGISLGSKIIRITILIPILAIALIFFRELIVLNPGYLRIVLTLVAVGMGFLINFLLGNIFSLLAFYVKQILAMRAFYENIATFLSGEIIPIFFIPVWAQFIVEILPFRYTLSFPIEIMMGLVNRVDISRGFGLSVFWLVSLLILYKFFFRLAIRKYEAEGI